MNVVMNVNTSFFAMRITISNEWRSRIAEIAKRISGFFISINADIQLAKRTVASIDRNTIPINLRIEALKKFRRTVNGIAAIDASSDAERGGILQKAFNDLDPSIKKLFFHTDAESIKNVAEALNNREFPSFHKQREEILREIDRVLWFQKTWNKVYYFYLWVIRANAPVDLTMVEFPQLKENLSPEEINKVRNEIVRLTNVPLPSSDIILKGNTISLLAETVTASDPNFNCIISSEVMKIPVYTSHGNIRHRLDLDSYLDLLGTQKKKVRCPLCEHPMHPKDLIYDTDLQDTILEKLKQVESEKWAELEKMTNVTSPKKQERPMHPGGTLRRLMGQPEQ